MWVIYIIDFLVLFAFFAADAFLSAVGVAFPYLAFAILVSGITFALIKAKKSKTGKELQMKTESSLLSDSTVSYNLRVLSQPLECYGYPEM